jgi:hypothetical protein
LESAAVSFFSAFSLCFGLTMALMAAIAGWLFRTSSAPLIAKLAIPALMTALACVTPLTVNRLLGLPVTIDFDALPQAAELVAFVPTDGERSVDLWLVDCSDACAPPPRAYETVLNEGLKQTLREAQAAMEKGGRVMLRKRGKGGAKGGQDGDAKGSGPRGVTNIMTDDHPGYEIDPSAFGLPAKD